MNKLWKRKEDCTTWNGSTLKALMSDVVCWVRDQGAKARREVGVVSGVCRAMSDCRWRKSWSRSWRGSTWSRWERLGIDLLEREESSLLRSRRRVYTTLSLDVCVTSHNEFSLDNEEYRTGKCRLISVRWKRSSTEMTSWRLHHVSRSVVVTTYTTRCERIKNRNWKDQE